MNTFFKATVIALAVTVILIVGMAVGFFALIWMLSEMW
jgi:hypothetical protein